jgi:8-oxo-dGTP diphosphatase
VIAPDRTSPGPPAPGTRSGADTHKNHPLERKGMSMTEKTTTTTDATAEQIRLTANVVLLGEFDDDVWVLLIERGKAPFRGLLALPGGHVDQGEDTEDAAHRELAEETGIRVGALTYVGAYAAPGRDPRGRYVSLAYAGRMPHRVDPTAGDDAARATWVRLDEALSGPLAFDHAQILRDALRVTTLYTR